MIRHEETTFAGKGVRLFRRAARPEGASRACLAILHGYGDHGGRYREFMEWMAGRGIECHALDFRGHGRSTGARGHVHRWEEYLEDLDAFLGLDSRHSCGGHPLFALGHSHGGLVLAAAGIGGLAGLSGCIFTAPYFRSALRVPPYRVLLAGVLDPLLPGLPLSSGLREEWMTSDEAMARESAADPLFVRVATPRWFRSHRRAQEEVLRRAGEFRLPALLLVPDADPVADPAAAEEFYRGMGSADRTLRTCRGMRHEPLREAGREAVYAQILEWIEARLGAGAGTDGTG